MKKSKKNMSLAVIVLLALLSLGKELLKKDRNGDFSATEMEITPAVVDGDSITKNIRLYGIDAPEFDQKYGKSAKKFLNGLVKNKRVVCFKHSRDRYNRIVAECFADGENVNAAMVRNGYAWAYRQYGDDFGKLEDQARKNKLGLWRDDNPTPPWEYRKQKRKENNK